MTAISRRALLAAAVPVVAAACTDNGRSAASTTPATSASTTMAPSTTSAAAATTSVAPATTQPLVSLPADPFTLGVASGDPDATSVVLWTRLAPDPLHGGGMPGDDVDVTWEIGVDEQFTTVTATGTVIASADQGHAVHVAVPLDAGWWWYRFSAGGYRSPVGRTRRAPAAGESDPDATLTRFAAASCQDLDGGHYAAHADIAAHQPDFVVWLGDYIYEAAGPDTDDPAIRRNLGPEPTTIEEYRNRYALYKRDPQLQAAHQACPWYVIWDDHEVENNYAGETPQVAADATSFPQRRAAAYQVWWEHTPTRLAAPDGPDYTIYRAVEWGDLLTVAMLDGRQYRSDQACGDVELQLDPPCPEVTAPERTMLGSTQEQWLFDTLDTSRTMWNVIANQTVMADATFNGAILNFDQWDGYPVERRRIMQFLADQAIPNVVVVTGDIHLAAVAVLRSGDPGVGTPVGVEFVSTSISSEGLVGDELTDVLKTFPDLVDVELAHRGYVMHTVASDRWTAEYRMVTDVADANSPVTTFHTYTVEAGSHDVVVTA